MSRLPPRLKSAFAVVAAHAIALGALEVIARGVLVIVALVRPAPPPLAEARHTTYDSELGWTNVPGAEVRDMYGPGRHLAIGPQGFRGAADARDALPEGWRRMVCSGDSFTFGYGVGEGDGYCEALARMAGRTLVANLAQGGYGLDQSFLRYRRDGLSLTHDLHLLAFITEDLVRMESDEFLGHGKPVLSLAGGEIEVRNVPVPRDPAALSPSLVHRLDRLAVVRVMRSGYRRLRTRPPARLPAPATTDLAVAILEELDRAGAGAGRGIELLAVHLPVREDYDDRRRDAWRAELGRRLSARGVRFVDLVPELRRVPSDQVDGLFIAPGELPYAGAEGHYSVDGNQMVARAILPLLPAATSNPPQEAAPARAGRTP